MSKKKQVRITIPSWITDIKGWDKNSNLQIVPIAKEDEEVSDKTVFVIKEVKRKK